jgi:Rha family phage regulatory protein
METNLVINKRQKVVTDSLTVAENFKKRHDRVVRKIENLINDDEKDLLIFGEISYQDSYGRNQKKYIMDRKSFSILCMSFSGKKALNWKMKFYDAFEAMENHILQKKNLSWQQDRLEGKLDRRELTDAIKKLVTLAENSGSNNADRYYESISKLIYSQLFDIKKAPSNFRDSLDKESLKQLKVVEWKTSQWLDEAIKKCKDYHQPYKEIKGKLKALVSVIGTMDTNRRITA